MNVTGVWNYKQKYVRRYSMMMIYKMVLVMCGVEY